MNADPHSISRTEIDALPLSDVFKLSCAISAVINDDYQADDEVAQLLMPLALVLDDSIMNRAPSDAETLACKLLVATGRTGSDDPEMRVCIEDARQLVGEVRHA